MTKSYFGDNLYTLRKQRGLSQDEFAEKMGVSRQAISKWERNESYPDTENLIAIAKFFGVSIDDIINTPIDTQNLESEMSPEPTVTAVELEDRDDKGESKEKNEEQEQSTTINFAYAIPYPIVITVIYILWGALTGWGWAVGWTLYVTIPLYYSVIICIKTKRLSPFNIPYS